MQSKFIKQLQSFAIRFNRLVTLDFVNSEELNDRISKFVGYSNTFRYIMKTKKFFILTAFD